MKGVDFVVLVVVSVIVGAAIASWVHSPQLTPDFVVTVFSGTVMVTFFLFVPVMGVRLFLEERAEASEEG